MNSDPNKDKPSLSRRDLLVTLGAVGLFTAGASFLRGTVRFLIPPVSQTRPTTIIAGPPADFPPGELTALTTGPALIGRDEGGLFALSATCTHLGCTVGRSGEELACPCHGSRFTTDGTNLAGPAVRPLPYLALALNSDGLVEVNLDQPVDASARLQVKSL
jgi:cytochrome b6-f complex iron-sulfur subunit